jgi:hypothetical protein
MEYESLQIGLYSSLHFNSPTSTSTAIIARTGLRLISIANANLLQLSVAYNAAAKRTTRSGGMLLHPTSV